MSDSTTSAGGISLIGGRLCLDFTNTVGWHASEDPSEWLTSYEELLAWAARAGALTEAETDELRREAERRPEEAAAALERAQAIREVVYRILSAAARGGHARGEDLEALNRALASALTRLRVRQSAEQYFWSWAREPGDLDRMVWPALRSAAELLTSPDLKRVKECAGEGCGWLFLDGSRNRSRRWCDMADCGNRAKARRHYQRSRAPG